MIICPLSYDECSKRILLRPKTAFLMTPSKSKRSTKLKAVISRVSSALKRKNIRPLDGCTLLDIGDTVCNICSTMQGCAMSIGFYNPQVPADALSNIFWEMGMVQGWGRPVLLVANRKEDLPSDFTRDRCFFYETDLHYIKNLTEIVQAIKDREQYYVNILANEAIQSADYERAIKYYQEAFLINGRRQILSKIRKLRTTINSKRIPKDLKSRLTSEIGGFLNDVTRSHVETTKKKGK